MRMRGNVLLGFSRTLLMVSVSSVICSVLLSIVLVVLCLRRRQRILRRRRRRRSSSSLRPDKSSAEFLSCRSGSLRSDTGQTLGGDRSPKRNDSLSPSSTTAGHLALASTDSHKALTRPPPPGSTCYNINGSMTTGAGLRAGTPHQLRRQQMEVMMYFTESDQCTVVPDAGVNYLPCRDQDEPPRRSGSEWRLVRSCSRSKSSDGMHQTDGGRCAEALHLDQAAATVTMAHGPSRRVRYPSTGTLASHPQYDHRFHLSSECLNPDRKVNTMSSIV